MSDRRGESGERTRARLFCALDPPPEITDAVVAWQAEQVREGVRAVRRESLHVTVAFLGERPEDEVEAVAAELQGLAAGPVEARLEPEPVPVPRRRPRLFALGIESPAAQDLQGRLAAGLRAAGVYEPPRQPFWPHLTVFRVRGGRLPHAFGRLQPLSAADGHAFGFVRVALYRSDLRPDGAFYTRLAANELPQPGGRQKR